MIRNACIEDLKDYFKINDLLGGLSIPQQKQLRANIGLNTDDEGNVIAEELTYQELLTKIQNNNLSAGLHYIIKDYQTIYQSNHLENGKYETWGYDGKVESQKWHLITTAVSSNLLDPRVIVAEHPEYTVEYNVKPITFDDGRSNKGTITYMKDQHCNSAHYDFKNVRFLRSNEYTTRKYYTFSYADAGVIKDASETNYATFNQLGDLCWNNVFLGETHYNIFEADCSGNTFYSGCSDCHFKWESVNNTFNEKIVDLQGTISNQYIDKGNDILTTTITKQVHNVNGAVIITFLDPITYAQQIIILDSGDARY